MIDTLHAEFNDLALTRPQSRSSNKRWLDRLTTLPLWNKRLAITCWLGSLSLACQEIICVGRTWRLVALPTLIKPSLSLDVAYQALSLFCVQHWKGGSGLGTRLAWLLYLQLTQHSAYHVCFIGKLTFAPLFELLVWPCLWLVFLPTSPLCYAASTASSFSLPPLLKPPLSLFFREGVMMVTPWQNFLENNR